MDVNDDNVGVNDENFGFNADANDGVNNGTDESADDGVIAEVNAGVNDGVNASPKTVSAAKSNSKILGAVVTAAMRAEMSVILALTPGVHHTLARKGWTTVTYRSNVKQTVKHVLNMWMNCGTLKVKELEGGEGGEEGRVVWVMSVD